GGSSLYLEWGAARRLLGLPGVHVFLVRARPGASDTLTASLRTFCARHGVLLQSNAELRRLVDGLLARATGGLWAPPALSFVLGSLGIANTLVLTVREQTRQIGVLRALGLTRGQVRRLVLAQALLLAGVGLVPGAAAGVGLARVLDGATAWAGPPAPFRIDAPV